MSREPIAIVGMSCLFPAAPDLDTYWRNIVSARDCITDPPPEAWEAEVFYDPASSSNDRVYCKRGGYIGPLAYFDPVANGVMPRAVEGGEPDQWLALQVARAALADAGYGDVVPERARTAVILGKGTYLNRGNISVVQHGRVVEQTLEVLRAMRPDLTPAELEQLRAEMKACLPPFNSDTAPSLIPNMVSGRIANRLDLMGPNYTVDAACASSLIAVEHASRGLGQREYDLALVGGVHVATPVPTFMLFCQLGALSRRERIRPFDKDADGTMLGGGVGMVVLKRLADAERDGNRIYALVRGVGVASDGRGLSVTAPRIEGEVLALERAYAACDVSPRTVGLVEAHGTGTPVGDVTEVQALHRVFGAPRGKLPACALGSVKSMISHLMPAAGIAGLIKVALALHHKVLPPTLGVEQPNPKLELDKTTFYLNTETRPWIHGEAEPRRGAINAFGFGGINAHVVLEEHAGAAVTAEGPPLPWDSEVVIVSAGSREALAERLVALERALDGAHPPALGDLAFTLSTHAEGSARIAFVAADGADLRAKLRRAHERLADARCARIQDTQGSYWFAEPLAAAGRTAFLFPGEGSQYVNMLADLCLHFPDIRRVFDRLDRIFAGHARGWVPSDYIFPRPAFSAAERAEHERRLFQMEGAFEAVVTSSWALYELLGRLGVRPDAIVGHSTGEYTAMLASGMIQLGDEQRIAEFVTELNRFYYREMALGSGIPRGALVALGADREAAAALAAASGGTIHVAMDNCPHQTVLAGSEPAIARCVEQLKQTGAIYERLGFDRPYHTPLFEGSAERLREFLSRWITAPAGIPTYSCTTVAPYPAQVEQIHDVAVRHWMQPVEFRRTIEAMHADGVRVFVEVGPRGNLSAFVGDVLRGKPHVAIPVNVASRSGTSQLNHLVALLAAQGLPLQLDALYERRSPRRIEWNAPSEAGAKKNGALKLRTDWIYMGVSAETAAKLRPAAPLAAQPQAAPAAPAPVVHAAAETDVDHVVREHMRTMERFLEVQQDVMRAFLADRGAEVPLAAVQPLPLPAAPAPAPAPLTPAAPQIAAPAAALAPAATAATPDIPATLLDLVSDRTGYPLEMLGLDLDLEADLGIDSIKRVEILGSFQQRTGLLQQADMEALSGRKTLREVIAFLTDRGAPGTAAAVPAFPFIDEVVSLTPGTELVARCRLDLNEERFLRDHALGRNVSMRDPDLAGLAVLPLTMSMEILAEAGSVLMPGLRLTGMRDVRAQRWIALDDERAVLQVVARTRPDGHGRQVSAQILEGGEPIVSATLLFADAYAPAPAAGPFALAQAAPSSWEPERIYEEGMFHGPRFRGVVTMDRTGADGAEATLAALPAGSLFAADPAPALVTDPVLLDQPGQVVGLWTAERLESAYVVFPFHLEALELYGPPPAPGRRLQCRARIEVAGEQVRSDLDVIDADQRLWARLAGWKDRRFDLPERFLAFLHGPRDIALSEDWPLALPLRLHRLQASSFPDSFFSAHGALWQRVLAHLILSRREREVWRALRTPAPRRLEWLLGRLVAKDALRGELRRAHGLELCPADIEILPDALGRPVPQGDWTREVPGVPLLSLSHSAGVAVAAVLPAEAGRGVGVDVEPVSRALEAGESLAFAAAERELLEALPQEQRGDWKLRLWCAKEAVGKALGRGLAAGPQSVIVERIEPAAGRVHARLREADGESLSAMTVKVEDSIVATAVAPTNQWQGDRA